MKIIGKVWHVKVSFKKTLAVLFYVDDKLVIFHNKKYWGA